MEIVILKKLMEIVVRMNTKITINMNIDNKVIIG